MKIMQSFFKLGSGTLVAQGITFLSLPLISRIYSPNEYGQLTFLLSVTALFVPIVTLKIETLIVTVLSEEKMKEYFKLSLVTTLIISVSVSVVFLLILILIAPDKGLTNIVLSIFFCVILFVQSISVLTIQLALRTKAYKRISQSSILQNTSTNALQITLGKIGPTATILVVGYLMGRLLGVLPIAKEPVKIFQEAKIKARKYHLFKNVVKENRYLLPASFLEVANSSLVIFIISIFFGYRYSGVVGLVQSLLMVPVTLLAGSFGSIVIAEISALNRNDPGNNSKKLEFLGKIIQPLFILFVLYVIFFIALANFILSVIFKNDWSGVKDLIPLLTIPVGINFFWNPFINFLYAECRWNRILKMNAIRITVVAFSAFACISTDQNWKVSVMAMFVSGAVVQITCMAVSFKDIIIHSVRKSTKSRSR